MDYDYFVDEDDNRVLVGLTVEQTAEFEYLDSLVPQLDRCSPAISERAFASPQEKRWLELFKQHEAARQLLAASTGHTKH